ncbi:MAG: 16S rRNA (uracil(1498)-N(3))-methyltransferase [Planctomycetota bacterium]
MTESAPWFFVPKLVGPGSRMEFDAREAQHATSSRRLEVGQALVVFDGKGTHAPARLTSTGKRRVEIELGVHCTTPVSDPVVHLATALPKGDRLATLLGMATQLGVASITALECKRSVVRTRDEVPERWTRVLTEAAKQSRRSRLPDLEIGASPAEFAQLWTPRGAKVLLLHPASDEPLDAPSTRSLGTTLSNLSWSSARALIVGPEGGLTDDEVAECEAAGAVRVALGDGILRIETAAVASVSLARQIGCA